MKMMTCTWAQSALVHASELQNSRKDLLSQDISKPTMALLGQIPGYRISSKLAASPKAETAWSQPDISHLCCGRRHDHGSMNFRQTPSITGMIYKARSFGISKAHIGGPVRLETYSVAPRKPEKLAGITSDDGSTPRTPAKE
jgi:hypothetical protein